MKGIIWIKTTTDGRGYFPYFEDYIKKSNIAFIGDGLNNEVIKRNEINFTIVDGILYYKTTKVNLQLYSHLMFIYCSELLTPESYNKLLKIEEYIKQKSNIFIFNPVSSAKNDYDKLSFFQTLKEAGLSNYIPEHIKIEKKENLNNIPFGYPYLLRSTSDWGGKNLFFIKNKEERDLKYSLLSKINATIIAVKFYSPYIKELGYNLNCRVNMIGTEPIVVLCDPFPKTTFTHRIKEDGSPSNPDKFEHVLAIGNNPSEIFTNSSKYVINLVDQYRNLFKFVQQALNLHTIAIDFIVNEDNIIFLECNLKLGISPYKVPQFIKYSQKDFTYYHLYNDDTLRNNKILTNLSYYPAKNIYIDIDGTIANNIPRAQKHKVANKDYYDDIEMDLPIEHSNQVTKILHNSFDIIYITSRPESCLTAKWLIKNQYYYSKIIFSGSLDKKIPILEKDLNYWYYIDDFSKGHETSNIVVRHDVINNLKRKNIRFSRYNGKNWPNILSDIKIDYNYLPRNDNIKMADIYNGYQCIHGDSSKTDILLTIFVITIMGDQLAYTINSINELRGVPFIVHFIVNISPTSMAYQKMNMLVKTKYFLQLDEDMILFKDSFGSMVEEAVKTMDNTDNVFNVCFKLKDDLLGITMDKYLYGVKIFNSILMKNIIYSKGISSVDRELNFRMEKIGKSYKLSNQIVGHHAKYRSNFEILLKYAKMTNSLLLNNIQYSVIDSMRIFSVINSVGGIEQVVRIAISKWENCCDVLECMQKYSVLLKQYEKIELNKFINYGYKKNIVCEKDFTGVKDANYYGIFGIIYALLIGFKYDFNYYPYKEFSQID
jgi:hypothetical protein